MLATLCATLGCLLNGSVIGFSSPAIPSLLYSNATNVYGGYTAVTTENYVKSNFETNIGWIQKWKAMFEGESTRSFMARLSSLHWLLFGMSHSWTNHGEVVIFCLLFCHLIIFKISLLVLIHVHILDNTIVVFITILISLRRSLACLILKEKRCSIYRQHCCLPTELFVNGE